MDFGALFRPKTAESAATPNQSASHNPSSVSVTVTRGADAFSNVSRQASDSLGKSVNKNIEAGIGYGVGISHGFAGKPGVVHKIQSCLAQTMARMMFKFGIVPNPFGQLPASLQSGLGVISDPSNLNTVGSVMQMSTSLLAYNGSQTEKAGSLESETNIFQMVLKQQQVIEQLMEENEKVRQILVEDLKVPQTKLQTYPSRRKSPGCECVECRRKQRRK